jgi:amidohydrolase
VARDTPQVTTNLSSLLDEARAVFPDAVRLRRNLHHSPEIGLQLPRTQAAILDSIGDLGLAVRTGESVSSVVAVLDGARPGPTVLLRGDMDALPLHEDTDLEFASGTDGAMHACGHDTHVAMLAGAARVLAGRREEIAGRVLFMFQPGEEGYHGARYMLEEGLLEAAGEPPSGAFALHISPMFASGSVNLRGGPQLASSDVLRITVTGRGGHASMPHGANDPIPVACQIVTALQTMVTRRTSVFDPVVVTIAQIRAGTTTNIIPETAYLEGTMRTLSGPVREQVRGHIRRVAEGIAAAHEMTTEVEIEHGYPVTSNDGPFAGFAHDVAAELLGEGGVALMDAPIMGAEDFSYVLERVPGAIAFLGACPPGVAPDQAAPNHSNRAIFNEQAMLNGVATYAAVALRHLAASH